MNEMHHSQTNDRTWPLPRSPWVMRMGWHDLLFAHWRVDPDALRPFIPSPLELDLRDGEAWIGVVPFRMTDVAPRCVPAIPGQSAFPELNVRTYVSYDGKPGVWFFSLDATNRLAVRAARRFFHLPYMDARMSIEALDGKPGDENLGDRKRENGEHGSTAFQYQCHRTHIGEPSADFVAQYQPVGPVWNAEPGTLEHWLTARYCLYSSRWKPGDDASKGLSAKVYRGEIDHPPWSLQNATCQIETNTMCDAIGLNLNTSPHLLFARDIHVRAWLIHRI